MVGGRVPRGQRAVHELFQGCCRSSLRDTPEGVGDLWVRRALEGQEGSAGGVRRGRWYSRRARSRG